MLLFNIIFSVSLFANTERVQSTFKDLGVVDKIYLSPGLFSVIEFPKPISEVIGQTRFIKAELSQSNPKSLTLYLIQPTAQPANLIIRSEKRVYVFDIIPSKYTHQDYIKVNGAFGGPSLSSTKRLLDSKELLPAAKQEPLRHEIIEGQEL